MPERPLIDSFYEVADLCRQRPPYAILARMCDTDDPTIKFAEEVGGAREWKMWTERQPYDSASVVDPTRLLGSRDESLEYYSGLHLPRLVALFARRFAAPEDLSAGAATLSAWLGERSCLSASEKTSVEHAVANSIVKWLQVGPDPVNPLLEQWAEVNEPRLRSATSRTLGKLLIKGSISSYGNRPISLDDTRIVNAITAADGLAMLEDGFWVDFGVRAAGGICRPAFLPPLVEKLTEHAEETGMQGRYDMQLLSRAYMTAVLQAHQKNPDRHSANTTRILETTRPKKGTQRAIDLGALVNVSNVVAKQMTQRMPQEQKDEAMLEALRPADMMHISDAFLRVLHVTRRSDMPARMQAKQFEEDVYHAEVVALLREGVINPLRVAGHAVLSRAPQAAVLQAHLKAGTSLTETLRLLRLEAL